MTRERERLSAARDEIGGAAGRNIDNTIAGRDRALTAGRSRFMLVIYANDKNVD